MKKLFIVLSLIGFVFSCKPKPDLVEFTVLQFNDVYEFGPLSGGESGGMARVAMVRKELLAENPNTLTVLAGDFVSPSLFTGLRADDGGRINGAQMIDVLNELGLDIATFGNHEFDLKEKDILKRIEESDFQWVSCNARHILDSVNAEPFQHKGKAIPDYAIYEFKSASGKSMKLGLIGVMLPYNKADYVQYLDVNESFRNAYEKAKSEAQLVFGLTHLTIGQDKALAAYVPEVPLLMGGHEHVNSIDTIGKSVITKADGNVKSVYIHRVKYDLNSGQYSIQSELKIIDDKIADEPQTAEAIEKWNKIADEKMQADGIDAFAVISTLDEPLEGREEVVRYQPANLPQLICRAIQAYFPQADAVVINSGCVRVDDVLAGRLLSYDILRSLPFGGGLAVLEMKGQEVIEMMDIGTVKNVGNGGYLQYSGIQKGENGWMIDGKAINAKKMYKIALPDYVAGGREANLGFLGDIKQREFPETVGEENELKNDIRFITIEYIKQGGE